MNRNDENVTILVSPFFPFNRTLSNELINKLFDEPNSFSVIYLDYSKDLGFDDFVTKVTNFILKSSSVYLISFGAFSFVTGEIIKRFSNRLAGVLFIEPDFSGMFLKQEYKVPLFKSRIRDGLIKFYSDKRKVCRKYFTKEKPEGFLSFILSLQAKKNKQTRLGDFIEKETKIAVLWGAVAKDIWPLPQILTEEYNIPVYKIKDNLVEYVQKNKRIVVENFQ